MRFLIVRNVGELERAFRIVIPTNYLAFYFGLYITGPYSELAFYIAGYYIYTGMMAYSPIYHLLRIRTRERPPEPPKIP